MDVVAQLRESWLARGYSGGLIKVRGPRELPESGLRVREVEFLLPLEPSEGEEAWRESVRALGVLYERESRLLRFDGTCRVWSVWFEV